MAVTKNVYQLILAQTPGSQLKDEPDLIVTVTHKMTNLNREQAYEHIRKLLELKDYTAFHLGGVLDQFRIHDWYKEDGYNSFGRFIEDGLGIPRSTAYTYMQLFNDLVESGVPWSDVEHLGWSKVRYLARVLTKDTAEEWIAKAEKYNTAELREYIRAAVKHAKAKDDGDSPSKLSTQVDSSDGPGGSQVNHKHFGDAKKLIPEKALKDSPTPKKFYFYPDQAEIVNQAIERAKAEAGTEYDNAALDAICLDYLAGPNTIPDILTILRIIMKRAGCEQALATFEDLWPEVQIDYMIPVSDQKAS